MKKTKKEFLIIALLCLGSGSYAQKDTIQHPKDTTLYLKDTTQHLKDTVRQQKDISKQQKDSAQQKKDTVKYWKKGGTTSLAFNQVSLNNWAAGGESSLSGTATFNPSMNYKKNKTTWDNSIDLRYGLIRTTSEGIEKNEDKLELTSKYGYQAIKKLYYSISFTYKTQFANGYSDGEIVSKFNAPGYVTLGLGMDYKPADYFSLVLSPATGQLTIVADDSLSASGSYGVTAGKKIKSALGVNLTAKLQKDIIKNVNLSTNLVLFCNYTDDNKMNRDNIDVNWEVKINIKAGKLLTTSILTNLICDYDVTTRTEFKEALGVGLSKSF
jgi:hypothetical protein